MVDANITNSFKRKVNGEIAVKPEGLNRFIVYTPFQFDDGDHYVIILRRVGESWILSDEGHTFMHLSYHDLDLSTPSRAAQIDDSLKMHGVQNDGGELKLVIPGKQYGDALFSFVQALSRIAHISTWTVDRVKSTFYEDAVALVESTLPFGRLRQNYSDPTIDPEQQYPIDLMYPNTNGIRWFIFTVGSDTRCQQSTIACLHYETKHSPFKSIVIYENQAALTSRYVAQLGDVTEKSFSTLGQKIRIKAFLETTVAGNGHTTN